MTANIYGHYSPQDVQNRLIGDIQHFAQKYGCIPDTVLMPPNLIPDVREVVIHGEKGRVYTVKLVEDRRQLSASYTVSKED